MGSKIPYIASTGLISKILNKIMEARRPDRFTGDFLETKLGFSGGSARAFIPLLKRLGFLGSDGIPTSLYDRFRNQETQGGAMADGLRNAYHELYDRNEYAHDLSKDKLAGLITEITGAEKNAQTTKKTVSTFLALKDYADFDSDSHAEETEEKPDVESSSLPERLEDTIQQNQTERNEDVNFAVSYTINLNLPETTNPEVFNAIFKALKENLLKRS